MKFIKKILDNDPETTKGMALAETSGWFNKSNNPFQSDRPIILRNGIVGNIVDRFTPGYYASGEGSTNPSITYRPVLWN